MIGSYEKGELKDVDLESKFQSLRIIWVRKILDKTNFHPWMAIANTVLEDLGGVNIFHTNLLITPRKRECLEKIPTFYRGNFYFGKNLHRNILRPRVYTVPKSLGQSLC